MRRIAILLAAVTLPLSCAQSIELAPDVAPEVPETVTVFGSDMPEDALVADEMNVRVSADVADMLEAHTGEDGYVRMPEVKAFADRGVVRMRRLFPYAGRFEARTREEGLHLWYVLEMGPEQPAITKSAGGMALIPGVELVELQPKIHIVGDPEVVDVYDGNAPATKAGGKARYPFNDPYLPTQWHYYNDGSVSGGVSGCDINVFPVWRGYSTGDKDVIVAVVDGGVDYSHEDLSANMWNNPEKSGNYRYGFNFVNNSFVVTAESHGTHVAGTIAAVNNNGKGVCGIAGGDASASQKGVKIMSCQIFQGNETGSGAAAIKWSADHGAVISQNSWGYTNATTTPTSLSNAVDYFIKYAGVDENGNQTGPMKGGVVIFAAGNEDAAVSGNDYGPIINVASVGADYRRAYYSNYGSWVDIAAPGGNVRSGNQVFSTLPGNKYGNMQGTSMACPHVSGVAALVLSYMYSRTPSGYTADALTKKLLNYTTSISSFNPNYSLGRGLVNAYRSVAGSSGGKAPKTPTDFAVNEVKANNVSVSVTVPVDEDDGAPVAIRFYYSKSDFTRVSDNLMYGALYVGDLNPGETLTGVFSGMDFGADYYVAAVAVDGLGNQSGLTSRIQVHTGPNSAPVITDLNSPRTSVSPHETISFDTEVVDPDGHYYAIELESHFEHPELDDKGVEIQPAVLLDTTVRNKPKIVAAGRVLASGKYTARMTVTDYFGASAVKDVAFEILPNSIPYKGKDMEDRIFTSRTAGTLELDCKEYFKDDDGEDLAYTIAISNETVVNMTASGGKFLLTPMNYGYSDITVTGTDVRGEQVTQTFSILVRDGSRELDVYPNPVRDDLFLRTGDETSLDIRVISASGAVFYSGSQEVTPFSPAVVDMRGAFPGSYTVMVGFSGKTVKASVVKL